MFRYRYLVPLVALAIVGAVTAAGGWKASARTASDNAVEISVAQPPAEETPASQGDRLPSSPSAPEQGRAAVEMAEQTTVDPSSWNVSAPMNDRDWTALAQQIDTEIVPLPKEPQTPLSVLRSRGRAGWSSFREPLPSVPVWNPPGTKRVGLQAGHWEYADAPDELADLRSNPGTSGGGKAEWEVTLDVANRAAEMLRAAGVEVDVLSTSIPVRYRANAFVSIHADGEVGGVLNGFKVARPGFSSVPDADNALVAALYDRYGAVTGLPRRDNQVSLRMTYYYAFNSRRYQHAVAPGVPQAIIETAFLTNWSDRAFLLGNPDIVARGIADGVLEFLRAGDAG